MCQIKRTAVLGLCGLGMQAFANIPPLPDSQKPVQIISDKVSFDHKQGLAVYEGNVQVHQGSRHLTANKLTIHRDTNNRIEVMVATGSPATFKAQQPTSKGSGSGVARTIKYYPQLDRVDLIERAELTQNGDTITGPTLSYNFVTEVLQGKSSKQERPVVTLQPKRVP